MLYADGARFTHRFVREQRRFGPEIEGLTPYDNSIAQRKVKFWEKKILVVCSYEAQTLRSGCIASPLPSHQFLERAGEVLWRNKHFTKITGLPPCITYECFFLKNILKNRFLEHVKFIFYINWWVDRTCIRLLSSVIRALYHMFLRFCFYKSKILALLQTLIKASNTTRNQKNWFLEHVKKVFYENWWVCQQCSQLPSSTIRLK